MVFHWRLSDSKSPQVSRNLLSILAVLNNVVVWMVSTRPNFKSSSPINNTLLTVPKAPIIIGVVVTFMFHNLFQSLARSRYLYFFRFFRVYSVEQQSPQFCKFSFFPLIVIRFGLLAEIKRSVCTWKSHRSLCVPFSRRDAGLYIYDLFVCSNLNFLHISQCITLPTQSYLLLKSFSANLLH